jgi:hypothetical protein
MVIKNPELLTSERGSSAFEAPPFTLAPLFGHLGSGHGQAVNSITLCTKYHPQLCTRDWCVMVSWFEPSTRMRVGMGAWDTDSTVLHPKERALIRTPHFLDG